MACMVSSFAVREERLIGALVPAWMARPRPVPPQMPLLPRREFSELAVPVLGMARLDRSGRLSVRPLLRRLGWRPGDRVSIDVLDAAVTVVAAMVGLHRVGGRGELALPAAARHMCGIEPLQPVLVAVYPSLDMLVIHSVDRVAALLAQSHARLIGGRDGG